MPANKEPRYFSTDFTFRPNATLEQYLANFAPCKNEKRAREGSTLYLDSRCAAAATKKFNPASKIIITPRNPVDFLYSYPSMLLWYGPENITHFAEALAAEEPRRQGKMIPMSTFNTRALVYRDLLLLH